MRGARCKALRRAFREMNGRPPGDVEIRHWGRWVEAWQATKDGGKRLVQRLLGVGAKSTVSEWRRLKRDYYRQRRAA